ncbi:LysR family transcriptional regulator [Vibrio ostreicida]|uniref:LysR family transcriptional regulator n=1 Tax=Vibrio ostreicida TaxID=526588 RepID=UPI003183BE34
MMSQYKQMMIFKAIVESGSISKAAEKLNLSKSVLSTQLKQLESDLSCSLLKRTTRKQSLTSSGERFYQHCIKMNDVMSVAWQDIRQLQTEPEGNLCVTAPVALMDSIVVPALSEAFMHYPTVSLSLLAEDRQLDVMQHNIDLAIRVGQSPDSRLKQKRIGQFRDILCQPRHIKPFMVPSRYIANQWQPKLVTHHLQHRVKEDEKTLSFTTHHNANTVHQVAHMIELNMGVGLIPEFCLQQYPNLQPCDEDYQLLPNSVYALHPYSLSPPPTVSMAIESIEHMLASLTNK